MGHCEKHKMDLLFQHPVLQLGLGLSSRLPLGFAHSGRGQQKGLQETRVLGGGQSFLSLACLPGMLSGTSFQAGHTGQG